MAHPIRRNLSIGASTVEGSLNCINNYSIIPMCGLNCHESLLVDDLVPSAITHEVGTVAGTDKDQKQRDSLRQTRFTRNARVLVKQHTETDSPVELSTTSKSSSAESSQD